MTVSATGTIAVSGAAYDPISAFEDALHAWVVAGSGLAADHVIWGDIGPIPTPPYISMNLKDWRRVSSDWLTFERTAGGDIIDHARGTRHPTLALTAFTSPVRFDALGSPEALLVRVTGAYRLPSVKQRLKAGGVGIGTIGTVRSVPGMRGVMFDPRAMLDIALHVNIDISSPGSVIETVSATLPNSQTVSVTKP